MQQIKHRIQYIDGLRGIAISMVILFHAFSRWPELVPYGAQFKQFPLFAHGNLGVQLFFMISGFVIFMSLENSRNFSGFIIRRWIRLFPAMLICSVIIFLTASFFDERPGGTPQFRDLLPGITFIEPYWWQLILGSPQAQLEGSFWSLYVEIKLYLVAGIFYFLIGGQRMIWVMIGLFLLAIGLLLFNQTFVENNWTQAKVILHVFSGKPCGWFAAGALFYRYYNEKKKWFLVIAIAIALASALSEGIDNFGAWRYNWERATTAIIIVSVFVTAVLNDRIKQILSRKFILLLGFISYPLYLFHENMMISLIIKTEHTMPWIPSLLLPVLPILFVGGAAWLVASFAEPPLRTGLKFWHNKIQLEGWQGFRHSSSRTK